MNKFIFFTNVCLFLIATCEASLCIEDQHVINNACVACPSEQSNLAGDDPSGPDTSCDTCNITTNQQLSDYVDQWITNPSNHPCGEVIGDWEVGRVTDMSDVFCGSSYYLCNSILEIYVDQIDIWLIHAICF